jgi:hypothetical protein
MAETVTPPDVPAVRFTARTGVRAAPPVEPEIKDCVDPAGNDAKLTARPEDGATTPDVVCTPVVVVPVVVVPVVVVVVVDVPTLIEFTNALVLGPK